MVSPHRKNRASRGVITKSSSREALNVAFLADKIVFADNDTEHGKLVGQIYNYDSRSFEPAVLSINPAEPKTNEGISSTFRNDTFDKDFEAQYFPRGKGNKVYAPNVVSGDKGFCSKAQEVAKDWAGKPWLAQDFNTEQLYPLNFTVRNPKRRGEISVEGTKYPHFVCKRVDFVPLGAVALNNYYPDCVFSVSNQPHWVQPNNGKWQVVANTAQAILVWQPDENGNLTLTKASNEAGLARISKMFDEQRAFYEALINEKEPDLNLEKFIEKVRNNGNDGSLWYKPVVYFGISVPMTEEYAKTLTLDAHKRHYKERILLLDYRPSGLEIAYQKDENGQYLYDADDNAVVQTKKYKVKGSGEEREFTAHEIVDGEAFKDLLEGFIDQFNPHSDGFTENNEYVQAFKKAYGNDNDENKINFAELTRDNFFVIAAKSYHLPYEVAKNVRELAGTAKELLENKNLTDVEKNKEWADLIKKTLDGSSSTNLERYAVFYPLAEGATPDLPYAKTITRMAIARHAMTDKNGFGHEGAFTATRGIVSGGAISQSGSDVNAYASSKIHVPALSVYGKTYAQTSHVLNYYSTTGEELDLYLPTDMYKSVVRKATSEEKPKGEGDDPKKALKDAEDSLTEDEDTSSTPETQTPAPAPQAQPKAVAPSPAEPEEDEIPF